LPLGSEQVPLSGGRQFSTSIDASGLKYVVPGQTITKLSFEGNGATLASTSFKIKAKQSPFLTVPGAIAIAAVLFAVAYAESLLRSLRRRKKQISGPIGLALVGALVGVIVVAWAWLLTSVQPGTPALVVCVITGAASGVAAGLAGVRLGRLRRARRRAAATQA
jgi:serine/threonine-protein kinase